MNNNEIRCNVIINIILIIICSKYIKNRVNNQILIKIK